MRISMVIVTALLLVGCAKTPRISDFEVNLPRPSGPSGQLYHVGNEDGFSPEFKRQNNMRPETTWAGYAKPYSIQIPVEVGAHKGDTGFKKGAFISPSGATVSFLVLDPVDYRYQGVVPKQDLSRKKAALLAKGRSSSITDVIVANGWIGYGDFNQKIKKRMFKTYLFFSEREVLQVGMYWQAGNADQEKEATHLMAYGLWSIRIG